MPAVMVILSLRFAALLEEPAGPALLTLPRSAATPPIAATGASSSKNKSKNDRINNSKISNINSMRSEIRFCCC